MDFLVWLAFGASVLLGVGRGVDMAFGTDLATELCSVGSVWWRYAALAAVVLLCVAAGYLRPASAQALCRRCPIAGVLSVLAAVCTAMAGAVRIIQGSTSSISVSMLVRAVLEIISAYWLLRVGLAWGRGGQWRAPTRSLAAAVAGSAVFYWRVLARFMENSSSWQRTVQTAMVWQFLAALVFLAALARALYLPETANGRTLCASALAAFALCLCWELPQAAAMALAGKIALADGLFSAVLCAVGALGGVCAALCLRAEPQKPANLG